MEKKVIQTKNRFLLKSKIILRVGQNKAMAVFMVWMEVMVWKDVNHRFYHLPE